MVNYVNVQIFSFIFFFTLLYQFVVSNIFIYLEVYFFNLNLNLNFSTWLIAMHMEFRFFSNKRIICYTYFFFLLRY